LKNKAIGIFDSGLGGLTVVKEVRKLLPKEDIIYFGDTARVPYGSKSKEVIIKYSREISRFLKTKEVKMIVVACNTASSFALKTLQEELDIPVIGVIHAGSKYASQITKGKIGVVGTKGTIKSNVYERSIKNIDPKIEVYQRACPLFVPLIEEGMLEDSITEEIAERYLHDIKTEIDTLILGCTHYPLIKNLIGKVCGESVNIFNPAKVVAEEVKEILQEKKMFCESCVGKTSYFASDDPEKFSDTGRLFLGHSHLEVEEIDIEKYI
jgi:glutamate racemase